MPEKKDGNGNTEPPVVDTKPPIVIQMTPDGLRQAIRQGIEDFVAEAATSAKGHLGGRFTPPCHGASAIGAHWLRHGDVDPDAFGKPAGSKVWSQAGGTASIPSDEAAS